MFLSACAMLVGRFIAQPGCMPYVASIGTGLYLLCILGYGGIKWCPQPPSPTCVRRVAALTHGVLSIILGMVLQGIFAMRADRIALPPALWGRPVHIDGTVTQPIAYDQYGAGTTRFFLRVHRIGAAPLSGKVRLDDYRHAHGVKKGGRTPAGLIRPGMLWSGEVVLKPPHRNANWPLHAWVPLGCQCQGALARGYVKKQMPAMGHAAPGYFAWLDRQRDWVYQQLKQRHHALPFWGIIVAVGMGMGKALSQAQWAVFRDTGTPPLVAISGLHVGVVAMWIGHVFGRMLRCFPRLFLWVPAPYMVDIAVVFGTGIYGLISGFAVPTQRAWIVLLTYVCLRLRHRQVNAWDTLGVAVWVILLLSPCAFYTASFWLSFSAVVALLLVTTGPATQAPRFSIAPARCPVRFMQTLRMGLRIQCAISLALLPWSVGFFQQAVLLGNVANLLAVPVMSLWVIPLSLLGIGLLWAFSPFSLKPGLYCLQAAQGGLSLLWPFLTHIAHWPYAVTTACTHSRFICAISVVLIYGGYAMRRVLPRRLCVLMGVSILFMPFKIPLLPALPYGQFDAHVLDVGQGLSVVIHTQHHVLVYDTGMHYPNGYDMGERVLIPFLKDALQINQVDLLMISHADNDHSGGARALMQALPLRIRQTSVPQALAYLHAKPCYQGQHWIWDGVGFSVLWPPHLSDKKGPASLMRPNNRSCVLAVRPLRHPEDSLLLTGDIQAIAEKKLIKINPAFFSSRPLRVLIAPHHGSLTSSSVSFLKALRPQVVIISSGFLNRFHLPHPRILARYQHNGMQVYNTAYQGAIRWRAGDPSSLFSKGSYFHTAVRHFSWPMMRR